MALLVVQWHVQNDGTLYGMVVPDMGGGVASRVVDHTITNFRVCLQMDSDVRWTYPIFQHTCTAWKTVT